MSQRMTLPRRPHRPGLHAAALAVALAVSTTAMLWVAVPGRALAQVRPAAGPTITPNYKDADLSQIIQAVSEVTGKNFIVDPRVNAKVTMLSSTPMSPAAFYQAFLSVLQVYGYVAVPAGNVIKIIPNIDEREYPSEDLPRNVNSTSDELVTQVITVKNISAAQLVPLLRPLIPQYGQLAAYPGGNMLIISDRASNVARIIRIVRRMDEDSNEPFELIPLHNASANDVVRTVNQLSQGAVAQGAAAVHIVADERTNSVLLSGDKAMRLRMKALILTLDLPMKSGGDTRVRYLHYADAEKLAAKLRGQASASEKASAGSPLVGAAAAAGGGANFGHDVTIWADEPTNALVITAPPKTMKSLMKVIDKLDIRRAQVQVRAIIVEIDITKNSNLGVQWIIDGVNSNTLAGVSNLPTTGGVSIVDLAAAAAGKTLSAISGSALGTGVSLAVGRYNKNSGTNFAALLQALRSDGASNIISTPSVITMNNEAAEVKVTQEIPIVTGSYATSTQSVNGTTSPFQTIQQEQVGTILKVTPHINEGNSVQLKISQEDSSPGAVLPGTTEISTNKRAIKTTVLVQNGGIVVLGGLISDTVNESEDRIPLLGRIPLIGALFRSRGGSHEKKELMVFIQPTILRNQAELETTSRAQYRNIRHQQMRLHHGKVTLLPGVRQPVIPQMAPPQAAPAAPPPQAPPQATPSQAAPAAAPPAGGGRGP
ncbi:MAG TPA: type II secretion system secretin GspD [Steroidobacteraceae bacterium]|nr:type II secretion system secretin GspD [Steroidobacteraceae bacterium]